MPSPPSPPRRSVDMDRCRAPHQPIQPTLSLPLSLLPLHTLSRPSLSLSLCDVCVAAAGGGIRALPHRAAAAAHPHDGRTALALLGLLHKGGPSTRSRMPHDRSSPPRRPSRSPPQRRGRWDDDRDAPRSSREQGRRSPPRSGRREEPPREGQPPDNDPRPEQERYGKPEHEDDWGKEPAAPKEEVNFGTSGLLTEEANLFNGVVIKYNQPPEARKPKRRWRLYPFKGKSRCRCGGLACNPGLHPRPLARRRTAGTPLHPSAVGLPHWPRRCGASDSRGGWQDAWHARNRPPPNGKARCHRVGFPRRLPTCPCCTRPSQSSMPVWLPPTPNHPPVPLAAHHVHKSCDRDGGCSAAVPAGPG